MELIRTLSQMVNCLRSRGIRRKVAVVCPNDPHTEYVIIRSLREEIAGHRFCSLERSARLAGSFSRLCTHLRSWNTG